MSEQPIIVWLKRDLRIDDNPCLLRAAESGAPVVPVFIWAPHEEAPWEPGAASRWWLHHSLLAFEKQLNSLGLRLILRKGNSFDVLQEMITATSAQAVFCNASLEPATRRRDQALADKLSVPLRIFPGNLLTDPVRILSKTGNPYQVFTPYWTSWSAGEVVREPVDAPSHMVPVKKWPRSEAIEDLDLLPHLNWAGGIEAAWKPGEDSAQKQLDYFVDEIVSGYDTSRDILGEDGVSQLSPYLHFGEISVRRVWHTVRASRKRNATNDGALAFLKELGWREFAHYCLCHFPTIAEQPMRKEFARFPWRTDTHSLRLWQKGRTGFPLIDAAMRQLWTTGWMHNRARMAVASFLCKDLMISWQDGARWFWDTLVDADLANNTLGWQWSAGCGPDAAPYFRIFNPVLQSKRFDPRGKYIRRWVPELAGLDDRSIHDPAHAPPLVRQAAGVELGETYPHPIVEHDQARRRALAALAQIKTQPQKS